ncbi:APC family permease [Rhodococcus erythropolis]|uniref:APC family permease n=1 Tax=Rhodococcus erythropolis TaxID=1833 RepID=UPI000AE23020|nr:APC family permease [Rhodococcus erythropolis]
MTAAAPENIGDATGDPRKAASSIEVPLDPHPGGGLRWYHGVGAVGGVVAAPFAVGLYYPILGTWGAVLVYGILALVAFLMNKLFAEMAGMFPTKQGGITIYASEAFTGRVRWVSVVTTFSYWMGYSFGLSFMATSITYIVQAQWWLAGIPEWTIIGLTLTGDKVVSIGAILLAAALAYLGPKVFARISLISTAALGIIIVLACLSPLFALDDLQISTAALASPGWMTFAVMLYVVATSVFGTELIATMAPSFRNIVHDTRRALRVAGVLVLLSVIIVPISATAVLGEDVVSQNPLNFPSLVVASIFGGSSTVVMIVNIVQMTMTFNLMVIVISGVSQLLCAMAEENLTLRQIGQRSKSGAPVVAILIATIMNVLLLLIAENPVAILLASNFGYVLAIILVIVSYIILKRRALLRDTSGLLRVRLGVPIAIIVLCVVGTSFVCAILFPSLVGGTFSESSLSFVILAVAMLAFLYRHKIQDQSQSDRI